MMSFFFLMIRRRIVVARPPFLITLCHPPRAAAASSRSSTPPSKQLISRPDVDPDHQLEAGRFLSRLLFLPQKRHLFHHSSPAAGSADDCLGRSLPVGEKLLERIRVINGERTLRLEGLVPPAQVAQAAGNNITAEDARRVIRTAQVRAARERVMAVQRSCVSYPEFVEIVRGNSSVEWLRTTEKDAIELSKLLESSGVVLKIGKLVFLHPDHVIQAMEKAIIPLAPADDDPRRSMIELLKKMEEEKAQIDERAKAQVRRELWAGLVFIMAQTVGFMRLTFWELSWDVMEPICFFFTSLYFMAGYAFFLRTSREPSLEAFFQVRFLARQRRLINLQNFDIHRFHHLRKTVAGRRISSD